MIYSFSQGSMEKFRWYELNQVPAGMEKMTEEEAAKRIRELFEDSVRYRLISDVPVGSCLSAASIPLRLSMP